VRQALAVALAALLALPATAFGHATLQSTVPERGAQLDTPPAEVVFKFDEAVEASFGALRVFDSAGQEVQVGKAYHPGGRGAEIAIKLKPGLGDGTYTATFRVVSADGHPVSSGFVFTVGDAAPPSESLDELLAGGGSSGSITNSALSVARGVQYGAIALGLGALIFLLVVWRPLGVSSRAFTRRVEQLLLVAGAAGLVSAIVAIVLQGAVGSGTSFWSALSPDTVREVLNTRFGTAWGIGVLAWAVVLIVLAFRPLRGKQVAPPPEPPEPVLVGGGGAAIATAPAPAAVTRQRSAPKLAALAVPLFGLALLPSLGGHTSVQQPVAVLLGANIVHVLAISAWLGGIAVLVFALRAATSELEPDARTPLLAGAVGRFSALATIALPLVLITGVVQSIVEVGSFPALLDSAFGRAVLIKIIVALAIVALGFVNRQRMLPALRRAKTPGRTGVLLRRTLRAELALGLVAIAVTGALSSYAPSVAESSGPYATSVTVGPARIDVTVDPAKVGPNQLHLYLFDAKTGAPFEQTEELTVSAEMPEKQIAKITLSPHLAGPGHYVVDGASLGVEGEWTIHTVIRVSDFVQYETPFQVPIS
jgi:copper transport protein